MNFRSFRQTIQKPTVLGFLLVFALSYLTYFHGYWNPPAVFWDENYHIASAQKYLNGVYFMEQHPPLGKLLIALGEKIIDANPVDNAFIGTDYATNFEQGFSFAGYRFFPALLGWMTALLFYGIFLALTGRALWATLLSFPYIFDNALIVHLRGAMLESTLLFGIAASVFFFLLLLRARERRDSFRVIALWFGIALGAVFTTKLLGLVMILLIPATLVQLYPDARAIRTFLLFTSGGLLLMYLSVWQIHFALGRTVNPALPDMGYYQASPAYREILTQGRTRSLLAFPVMLKDSIKFVRHYNRGTPRLDLCKLDENGSPWYFWPIGARSINFRWETPNGQAHRYLYLQANPVAWWSGFLAVLITASFFLTTLFSPAALRFKNPWLLLTFFGLYVSYMTAISRIGRVMYLYHYFIPLLMSFVLIGLVFLEIDRVWRFVLNEERKNWILLVFGILVFAGFQFYRPLTYYEPLTKEQFQRRAIMKLWELECIGCPPQSTLVVPTKTN